MTTREMSIVAIGGLVLFWLATFFVGILLGQQQEHAKRQARESAICEREFAGGESRVLVNGRSATVYGSEVSYDQVAQHAANGASRRSTAGEPVAAVSWTASSGAGGVLAPGSSIAVESGMAFVVVWPALSVLLLVP